MASQLVGWGEVTFDLTNVANVHEAIAWAESQLAAGAGCYSKAGKPVHDREYVLFVKAPHEDRYVQIAGSNPTLAAQRVPRFETSD